MEPRRPGCEVTCVDATKKKEYITHLASRQNMSAETPAQEIQTPTETNVVESTPDETPIEANTEGTVQDTEQLMKLVIDQESELGSTKTALQTAEYELKRLQTQWKEREDNERVQTKSKAEALSKALVDSWTASLPADMMTNDNKKAIFAMAQNFPEQSVKMMEIAHKASKKYKSDIDALKFQQEVKQKRELESRVTDIITKKRRVQPETTSVVHAASVGAKKNNPFTFDASNTSSSLSSVRAANPQLFSALAGYSGGNLRDRMGQIAGISRQ